VGISDATAGGPRPWQEFEQEDLERWWAEMERQVLTEELGLGPERPPDVMWTATSAGSGPPAEPWEPPDPSDLPDPPELADPLDPSPPLVQGAVDHAAAHPEQEVASALDEPSWWRAANRAVVVAGTTLREAEQAMSHARRLVRAASVADADDQADWESGQGGRLTEADDALAVLATCTEEQRDWLADLLLASGGGGLVERPRIALTDALSGTLLALTDLPGLRRAGTCGADTCSRNPSACTHDLSGRPGLGPPGDADGYRPSAPLDRWVRARDRRCRFPGCRRRVPRAGELDHSERYPLGETSASNLVGYCTGHHRGKHQAPGWQHDLGPDGTLTVTTPTGLNTVTTPPPY
jgi:hypothetical protein